MAFPDYYRQNNNITSVQAQYFEGKFTKRKASDLWISNNRTFSSRSNLAAARLRTNALFPLESISRGILPPRKSQSIMKASSSYSLFDAESIWSILLRIAPPVMLAQLIQAMYNIVDSYFVGQFSGDGLTALSIVYPVQLIVTAIAVGTGVGVNTLMSRYDGQGNRHLADRAAGTGTSWPWLVDLRHRQRTADGVLCRSLYGLSRRGGACRHLWHHRLRRQPGGVFGEHLEQGPPGPGQYAAAYAGPDRRCRHQHRAGPGPDFRFGPDAGAGCGRRRLRHRGRSGAVGPHCLIRPPAAAQCPGVLFLRSQDLPPGVSLHFHADALHRVHHGPEHDSPTPP